MKRCWKKHNIQGHVEYIYIFIYTVCAVASRHHESPWLTTLIVEFLPNFEPFSIIIIAMHIPDKCLEKRVEHRICLCTIFCILILPALCSGTASPTIVGPVENPYKFFYFSFPLFSLSKNVIIESCRQHNNYNYPSPISRGFGSRRVTVTNTLHYTRFIWSLTIITVDHVLLCDLYRVNLCNMHIKIKKKCWEYEICFYNLPCISTCGSRYYCNARCTAKPLYRAAGPRAPYSANNIKKYSFVVHRSLLCVIIIPIVNYFVCAAAHRLYATNGVKVVSQRFFKGRGLAIGTVVAGVSPR